MQKTIYKNTLSVHACTLSQGFSNFETKSTN